jgi:dihydroorotate dehydrogenase electron transfer subunit
MLSTQVYAGQQLHLSCAGQLQKIIIMRIHPEWIEGISTQAIPNHLMESCVVECISGEPLQIQRRLPLWVGEGIGTASFIALAETVRHHPDIFPLVLLDVESLPFKPQPSLLLLEEMPAGVIAAIPLLDNWKIASRLASESGAVGCFEGNVSEFATYWLAQLHAEEYAHVEIIVVGKKPLCQQMQQLAADYGIPCQTVELSF